MIPIELVPLVRKTQILRWRFEKWPGLEQKIWSVEQTDAVVWRPKRLHEAWTAHLRARAEEDRTRGD